MFNPRVVEAALALPDDHALWCAVVADDDALSRVTLSSSTELPPGCLDDFGHMLSRVIDFRSRFTATHSSGVAACAVTLALLSGMPEQDVRVIRLAGYLHDVGKLAVSNEIIEKPGQLTAEEWEIVRSHVAYTGAVLWRLGSPSNLQGWATHHHERPNGTGYPWGLAAEDLDLGSRIMAVADVFVALTEDRPYRTALDARETTQILAEMAARDDLDTGLVRLLIDNYGSIDADREGAQVLARHDFDALKATLRSIELSGGASERVVSSDVRAARGAAINNGSTAN
jgi:HD-GYP domain-containing protein (c-di-GMP phosphodiesterase class II)